MSLQLNLSTHRARIAASVDKLRWGLGSVGVAETASGTVRLLRMRLRQQRRAEIRLRSGPILEFDCPSQFPTMLVMFGDFIDPEYALLRSIARPDWVVADVGAAIGSLTVFAAGLPCAMVHAFEPSSANVAMLSQNVRRNGVESRVKIYQLAFSNADGESWFETTPSTWLSRLSSEAAAGVEKVAVRTLSGEFERLGIDHLSVLKIDVAGFEPNVIEGAMPFVAAGKADMLIFLLGLPSLPWYEKIAAHNYRFFYYHPIKRTLYEVTSFDEATAVDRRPWPARNIIAINGDAIARGIVDSITVRNL